MIELQPSALETIRSHGVAAYPFECCGALVGEARETGRLVTDAWPLDNASAEASRARRFEVSAADYRAVEGRARADGRALLGFYHSHPDAPAEPSAHDLLHAWPHFDYIILSIIAARPADLACWRLRDDRAAFTREEISCPSVS